MGRTAIVNPDDFNRASLGANYTQIANSGGFGAMSTFNSLTVSGSSAQPDANRQAALWAGAGSFTNDQYASIVISGLSNLSGGATGSDYTLGVIARASGTTTTRTYYEVVVKSIAASGGSEQVDLNKWVNETMTNLHTSSTVTITDGQRIEIEVIGTTIRALLDGVLISGFSVTDSSISTGAIGICGSGGDVIKGDNLIAGSLTASTAAGPLAMHHYTLLQAA